MSSYLMFVLVMVLVSAPGILMEARFERCLDKWEFHCEDCKYWNCPYGHYRFKEKLHKQLSDSAGGE